MEGFRFFVKKHARFCAFFGFWFLKKECKKRSKKTFLLIERFWGMLTKAKIPLFTSRTL